MPAPALDSVALQRLLAEARRGEVRNAHGSTTMFLQIDPDEIAKLRARVQADMGANVPVDAAVLGLLVQVYADLLPRLAEVLGVMLDSDIGDHVAALGRESHELAEAMLIRAAIRRSNDERKSVVEGRPDRLATQLEAGAAMIARLSAALAASEIKRRQWVSAEAREAETGWLIERNDLGAPQWLQFGPGYGNTTFWPDANKAMRFARKIDAETFIAMHEASDPALRATEYKWIGGAASPANAFSEGAAATLGEAE
jgi:hypothetical protein